jgi:hypothetical protein
VLIRKAADDSSTSHACILVEVLLIYDVNQYLEYFCF